MVAQTQLLTVEDLARLPDDGTRYELVEGVLHRMPPAGQEHGGIAFNLAVSLGSYVQKHQLGHGYAAETGFLLSRNPDTVRAPDVAFVRRERLTGVQASPGFWPGAPDLVAEVISPRDLYTEVAEKVEDWLNAGTRLVIVIDPRKRRVTVYRSKTEIALLTEEDMLDGGEVVPGWSVVVRDLFV